MKRIFKWRLFTPTRSTSCIYGKLPLTPYFRSIGRVSHICKPLFVQVLSNIPVCHTTQFPKQPTPRLDPYRSTRLQVFQLILTPKYPPLLSSSIIPPSFCWLWVKSSILLLHLELWLSRSHWNPPPFNLNYWDNNSKNRDSLELCVLHHLTILPYQTQQVLSYVGTSRPGQ